MEYDSQKQLSYENGDLRYPFMAFSFSANPPYRSLSFFSFRIHYVDFPYCLLLLLSISVFLLFSFFPVFTPF